MSIRTFLYSFQQKYPLPAQTTFFDHDIPVVAVVQDNVQVIALAGLPNIADYGITQPVVMLSATSDNSTAVISGINNIDWGAGTAELLISFANVTNFDLKMFVCQSKAQLN
jgi:hypothetical protein